MTPTEHLKELLTEVEETLRDPEGVPCCRHVASTEVDPIVLCPLHPGLGVRCAACWTEHAEERHSDVPACTFCGTAGEALAPVALPATLRTMAVRSPTTSLRDVTRRVETPGLLSCRSCAAELQPAGAGP